MGAVAWLDQTQRQEGTAQRDFSLHPFSHLRADLTSRMPPTSIGYWRRLGVILGLAYFNNAGFTEKLR